jgi:hypothetical protein
MNKCFDSYESEYQALPFERHQAELRRRKILDKINTLAPRSIAEVGCGARPLFCDLTRFEKMTVVEPGDLFAKNAQELALSHTQASAINIKNCLLEEMHADGMTYDLMVLSALLHEQSDLPMFLRQAAAIGGMHCQYLFVVPNAESFHRQFALRDGIIDDIYEISAQQKKLQQHKVFSLASLEAALCSAGFKIQQAESIIFKPFTHGQMEQLLSTGILTEKQIYTFCEMVDLTSNCGSELLVIASYEG